MKKRMFTAKVVTAASLAAATLLSPFIAEATSLKAKSGVNVRSYSSTSASKIDYASSGKIVTYLGMSNGWYKISIDGRTGYTSSKYWQLYKVTSTGGVNIRKGPGSGYSKVGYAYKGRNARALGRNGSWIYVDYNGTRGFTHKNYWKLSNTAFYSLPFKSATTSTSSGSTTSTIGSKVVYQAKKLLGAPYVYGGDSWSDGGFDCSGLTQYVYKQVGISIPRTVTQQWYGISRKISSSNRRIGDIVVLTDGYSMSHAGIYIGDNKMIHAPRPGYTVTTRTLDWYQSQGRVKGYLRPYN